MTPMISMNSSISNAAAMPASTPATSIVSVTAGQASSAISTIGASAAPISSAGRYLRLQWIRV